MTSKDSTDVIDQLAGVDPDTSTDAIRRRRPETRRNAQASYDALFAPDFPGTVTAVERFAVAAFIASLHRDDRSTDWYSAHLRDAAGSRELPDLVAVEAAAGAANGPYGRYPQPALQRENTDGPGFAVSGRGRTELGWRLSAGLEHAHLLVFRPRESSRSALDLLIDAGWSADDIVTLSQLIAFLTFQLRVVHGLRELTAHPTAAAEARPPHETVLKERTR